MFVATEPHKLTFYLPLVLGLEEAQRHNRDTKAKSDKLAPIGNVWERWDRDRGDGR